VIKKDVIVEAPKDQKPPEPEPSKPDPSVGQPGGQEGGQVGGQVGGTVGGTVGGQIGGQLGGQLGGQVGGTGTSGVIPFGAGMTRPSQPRVVYTPSATVARVEGVMIVRCVIMATGSIQNCRVIKPLPHFDNVVQQLQSQRITPLTFQGRPVNVEYTWTFKMKMP
jgi:protein TonB